MTELVCADPALRSGDRSSVVRAQRSPAAASWLLAIAAAAAIGASYVRAHGEVSSLTVWWAAAFLFFVVEEDLRRRRIPNWLTFPGLGIAFAVAAWGGGGSGLLAALLGAGLALAIFFPLFLLRCMGAGDAKALLVLGALWGPGTLLGGLWWMLVTGGLMALGVVLARGALWDVVRRWGLSLWTSVVVRQWTYIPPKDGSGAQGGVPFGVAIGLGAVAYQLWGLPWT